MPTLEVITGRALNPGAALTAATANSGDVFGIRAMDSSSAGWIEALWGQMATAGLIRVRSNRLHDAAQAMRARVPAAVIRPVDPLEVEQVVRSLDQLTVEIAGGAAETDSVALMLYYQSVSGIGARLATWDQIKPRVANLLGQEVAVAGPAVAGDWSAGTTINTTFDTIKAGVDYAVLGYVTDTACLAIAIRGADTGNVRAGGPGPLEPLETRVWFLRNSNATGQPMIPIINGANKLATQAFVALNTAAGTVNVVFQLAELTP